MCETIKSCCNFQTNHHELGFPLAAEFCCALDCVEADDGSLQDCSIGAEGAVPSTWNPTAGVAMGGRHTKPRHITRSFGETHRWG